MEKEQLAKKTRDELRAIAKEMDIAGRGSMTKAQLVDAIFDAQPKEKEKCTGDNTTAEEHTHAPRDPYIEKAEAGTIMAFKLPNGKVKSAKLVKRSIKRRVVKLETAYGKEFCVPFDDIIWVRTCPRWPKGVLELLKGSVTTNKDEKQES